MAFVSPVALRLTAYLACTTPRHRTAAWSADPAAAWHLIAELSRQARARLHSPLKAPHVLPSAAPPFPLLCRPVWAEHCQCAAERDPEFRAKAKQKLDPKKTLIPYCSLGGTIKVGAQPWAEGRKSFPGDPERQFGRESRSLKGCFELQEVRHDFRRTLIKRCSSSD